MKALKLFLPVVLLLVPSLFAAAQQVVTDEEPIVLCGVKETKPTFNGGDVNTFSKWVRDNQRYPKKALKNGIEGRVTLTFTIDEQGKMVNIRVIKGVHRLLDKEALRVVKSAPDAWKPGIRWDGKPNAVAFTFPVVFRLPQ